MALLAHSRGQIGELQRNRPAVAQEHAPDQPPAQSLGMRELPDAEPTCEVFGHAPLSSIPENDVHGIEILNA
jgi:hypothetical protein